MSVIRLSDIRASRNNPSPEHVHQDQFGRAMYRFALGYDMDGQDWCTHIWAYSIEDAEARVAAMARTLIVLGQVHAEVAG